MVCGSWIVLIYVNWKFLIKLIRVFYDLEGLIEFGICGVRVNVCLLFKMIYKSMFRVILFIIVEN